MCYTGLIKRIVPFALTFAVGLFVASFFVSIALPTSSWRVNRRSNRFHEMQQLRIENENLREELRQARIDNEELRLAAQEDLSTFGDIPDAHHPPAPPKRPKRPAAEIGQTDIAQ